MVNNYLLLFIFGGTISVLTKYAANNLSPKIASVLATLPIGIFSAYFVVHEDKLPDYLRNYLKQIIFIIGLTLLYMYLINKTKFEHRTIFIILLLVWIIFMISQLY